MWSFFCQKTEVPPSDSAQVDQTEKAEEEVPPVREATEGEEQKQPAPESVPPKVRSKVKLDIDTCIHDTSLFFIS